MNKVFAIVIKNRNKCPDIINKNPEELSLCKNLNVLTYYIDDLILIVSSSQKNEIIKETNNSLLAYSGILYLDFIPKSTPGQLETEKLNFLSDEYEKKGDNAVFGINGKFNLIIYDKNDKYLKILNDELGLYPLFYYENEKYILFCNDYEPILKFNGNLKYETDTNSLIEYFLFGAPQNNKTFFKNIRLMPPGSKITVSSKGIKIQKNFPVLKIQKNQRHISEIADEYFSVFKKELDLILKWYPDIDVTLTGGADTRMILGAMSEEERIKRTFVTFSSPYLSDEENQDIQIANVLAKKYNLKHKVICNELFAIKTLDSKYFTTLRDISNYYISGYLGSETLRFNASYPNNISEITRALITSDENIYNYASDFLIYLERNLNFKQKYNIGLSTLKKYLSPDVFSSFNIKNSHIEIRKSIDFVKTAFLEIPYTTQYITRSFFSRHCGGARSSVLMPCYITRYMLSPFMSPKLLKIILGINPQLLDSRPDHMTYLIYKNNLPELSKIHSNSHLGDYNEVVLPKINYGKNAVYQTNPHYPDAEKIFTENMQTNYSYLFNFEKIKSDFFEQDNDKRYIWMDLFLWLNYINEI